MSDGRLSFARPQIFTVTVSDEEREGKTRAYRVGCVFCKIRPFKNLGDGLKLLYRHECGKDHIASINLQATKCTNDNSIPPILAFMNVNAEDHLKANIVSVESFPCAIPFLK